MLLAIGEDDFPQHLDHRYALLVAAVILDVSRKAQKVIGLGLCCPRILKQGLEVRRRKLKPLRDKIGDSLFFL